MAIIKQSLTGNWQFRQVGSKKWYPATVPGVVHTDLLKSKLIPDPFLRMNENVVRWIEDKDWEYHKEFVINKELLEKEAIELVFHGLDTYADIFINSQKVGCSENMFIPWRKNIKKFLKPGKNEIEIKFYSATKIAEKLESKHGKLDAGFYSARSYVRKSQYSFGWDWGPRLVTCGIWLPVELVAYDNVRINDVYVKPELNSDFTCAEVTVETEISCIRATNIDLNTGISHVTGKEIITNRITRHKLSAGNNVITTKFRINDPLLWWPNGYGEQNLYQVTVILNENSQTRTQTFGIRKLKLVQKPDEEGKSFIFYINNVPIFAKGCNWIPADSFLPAVSNQRYAELLELVRTGNMNMLRIWGGGIYESDEFYRLCDEKGILVWQDFMFACAEYPELDWFQNSVREEAEYQVRRLRNHPSIVLWCGNNENEAYRWGLWGPKRNPPKYYGETIYYKTLPSVCKKLDSTRPYWPSSPYGDEKYYNSQSTGDRHQWDVWSGWQDWTNYRNDTGRFISEFGFQSLPHYQTIIGFTNSADRYPVSEVMVHHNKQGEDGMARLWRFLVPYLGVPRDLPELVFWTQLTQGEALSYGIRHWRQRKFKTSGTLIWQLNDCWPVASWSLVDYNSYLKPSYYIVKRAFAEVLLSLDQDSQNVYVWIVNDKLSKIVGDIELKLIDFSGKIFWHWQKNVTVPVNSSVYIHRFTKSELLECIDTKKVVLYVAFTNRAQQEIASDTLFFVSPKYLILPEPKIFIKIRQKSIAEFEISIQSNQFVKSVLLDLDYPVIFSDNCFDLLPGIKKVVNLNTKQSLSVTELKQKLTIFICGKIGRLYFQKEVKEK